MRKLLFLDIDGPLTTSASRTLDSPERYAVDDRVVILDDEMDMIEPCVHWDNIHLVTCDDQVGLTLDQARAAVAFFRVC